MRHKKTFIVVRSCSKDVHHKKDYCEKAKEAFSSFFSQEEHFKDYLEKHGMHFSEKLANYVCHNMVNACEIVSGASPTSPKHSWTADEVEQHFNRLNLSFVKEHKYDYQYAANMAYSDFYGPIFVNELDCIKYAHAYISDPDGYPELAFSRWLADVLVSGKDIGWSRFI